MKITEVVEKPEPPPKKIILELTEEEAGLIQWFARFYTTNAPAGRVAPELVTAADTLAKKLMKYKNAPLYPYDGVFE
jgi:hypothetical protein